MCIAPTMDILAPNKQNVFISRCRSFFKDRFLSEFSPMSLIGAGGNFIFNRDIYKGTSFEAIAKTTGRHAYENARNVHIWAGLAVDYSLLVDALRKEGAINA